MVEAPDVFEMPRSERHARLRAWLGGTLPGRILLAGATINLAVYLLGLVVESRPAWFTFLDLIGGLGVAIGVGTLVYRMFVAMRARLLWHVRRKLTLSYIFLGVVPVLLAIAFFALCGLLLFFNVSSYLLQRRIQVLVEETRFLAQAAAMEVERSRVPETLEHRQEGASVRYPAASYAVVPAAIRCEGARGDTGTVGAAMTSAVTAGPWRHLDAPDALPSWVPCGGFAGLIAYRAQGTEGPGSARLAVRAAALPDVGQPTYAVVVDVPLTATLAALIRDDTGITIGDVTAIVGDGTVAAPVIGRSGDVVPAMPQAAVSPPPRDGWFEQPLTWVSFLDFADWDTGRSGTVSMAIGMSPAEIYRRVSAAPVRFGAFSFDQVLLLLLTMIAGAFFVIQVIALVMGLGLARSITGSVHELFVGTGRIRQGDFTHKIPIRTRDQLGELADSFNSMTTSIEGLLHEKAEKERLEQELRIARNIQMSLLPQGQVRMPGLALAAYCEPAREVGGDYYDFLPLDEHRLAVLIADVAGKGTSAALYMAELKGVMLSLSRHHTSPRELLIEANRIISQHLDSRSFITMTYAIVDMKARTFTYARAGHCPLLYVPGPHAAAPGVRILAPDGLVLGLKLDRGEMFERLLKEETLTLTPGDLIVLYTDGISETLEVDGETSGEHRLGQIVAEHRALSPEELRERVLRELAAIAGSAAQHDDMTMLLLKVDEVGELV